MYIITKKYKLILLHTNKTDITKTKPSHVDLNLMVIKDAQGV